MKRLNSFAMKKVLDITLPVSEGMPVWPGDPAPRLQLIESMADGAEQNLSHLSCCVHCGTHVDAPLHFLEKGASVDQLSFEALMGPAVVADLADIDVIEPSALEALDLPDTTERLLLKTKNSELWENPCHAFRSDFVALTADAAQWVANRNIRLIGVDYLSVQLFQDSEPTTHQVLLSAGVVCLEGLDLRAACPGEYHLICLPMKLMGCEGAPARAVLLQE